jgi:hypothetical protein
VSRSETRSESVERPSGGTRTQGSARLLSIALSVGSGDLFAGRLDSTTDASTEPGKHQQPDDVGARDRQRTNLSHSRARASSRPAGKTPIQWPLQVTSASRNDYGILSIDPFARGEEQASNPVNWAFKFWTSLRTLDFYNANVALIGAFRTFGDSTFSPLNWAFFGGPSGTLLKPL